MLARPAWTPWWIAFPCWWPGQPFVSTRNQRSRTQDPQTNQRPGRPSLGGLSEQPCNGGAPGGKPGSFHEPFPSLGFTCRGGIGAKLGALSSANSTLADRITAM
jgi:hypothetical protein